MCLVQPRVFCPEFQSYPFTSSVFCLGGWILQALFPRPLQQLDSGHGRPTAGIKRWLECKRKGEASPPRMASPAVAATPPRPKFPLDRSSVSLASSRWPDPLSRLHPFHLMLFVVSQVTSWTLIWLQLPHHQFNQFPKCLPSVRVWRQQHANAMSTLRDRSWSLYVILIKRSLRPLEIWQLWGLW